MQNNVHCTFQNAVQDIVHNLRYISYTTQREIKLGQGTSLCDALIHGPTGHREKSRLEWAQTWRKGRDGARETSGIWLKYFV